MNAKILTSISAALIVSSFAVPASAQALGDHPAVVVARTWNSRGIATNRFIPAPPASTTWVAAAPGLAEELPQVTVSTKLDWSAAIGTGYSARTSEPKHNLRKSETNNTVATPDWTATIGTGMAATRPSVKSDNNAPVSSSTPRAAGTADWTSRIGSGHPFDSAEPVASTTVAKAF
jgi:hypothetical protein